MFVDFGPLNVDSNTFSLYSVFPSLPKLEKLSLSYTTEMEIIGDGAFSGLPNLKEFYAIRNIYLREIHANAFARPGQEAKDRLEFPPLEKFIIHNNNISRLDRNLFGKLLFVL